MSMNHWERYGPASEAYSRVTNPERFRPLHTFMVGLIGRLETAFDVERLEGYGLDDELEKGDLVRPSVKLVPRDLSAAPILVSFTAFPGLRVRVGLLTPFPVAGVTLAMKRRTVKPPVWFKWWTT